MFKLVIFTLEGTLIAPADARDQSIGSARRFVWLPGRMTMIRQLARIGVRCAIATNASEVAFGARTVGQVHELYRTMVLELGGKHLLWPFEVCCTHPEATELYYRHAFDARRKPNPGMVWSAMMRHQIMDVRDVLLVGNSREDATTAAQAGVRYCAADEYFAGSSRGER